jgi:hypothetical protein
VSYPRSGRLTSTPGFRRVVVHPYPLLDLLRSEGR